LHASGIDSVQRTAADVRLELVHFIRSDSSLGSQIQSSLEDTDTLEQYLDRMSKSGTWGDGNMLSAASLCYKRRLEILKTDRGQPLITDNPALSSMDSLFLGYVSSSTTASPQNQQNHYISLRRVEDNDIQQNTNKFCNFAYSSRSEHVDDEFVDRKRADAASLSCSTSSITDESTFCSDPAGSAEQNTEPLILPCCWTRDQWTYFKDRYPWLYVQKGCLGCLTCCDAVRAGLDSQLPFMSHEWSKGVVTSQAVDKQFQQKQLRKKVAEHRASKAHTSAEELLAGRRDETLKQSVGKQHSG